MELLAIKDYVALFVFSVTPGPHHLHFKKHITTFVIHSTLLCYVINIADSEARNAGRRRSPGKRRYYYSNICLVNCGNSVLKGAEVASASPF